MVVSLASSKREVRYAACYRLPNEIGQSPAEENKSIEIFMDIAYIRDSGIGRVVDQNNTNSKVSK